MAERGGNPPCDEVDWDHLDFEIGKEFWCSDRRWRCTDTGTRVIVAIRLDESTIVSLNVETKINTERVLPFKEADREGWFDGPPCAVAEYVFDKDDFEGCTLTRDEQ